MPEKRVRALSRGYARAGVRCGCIDIGSNTTRLLVADVGDGALAPILELRAFTRLGRACPSGAAVPPDALAALADVVTAQVGAANAQGARALRVVATAAIRRAANARGACAALSAAVGVAVEVLDEAEEARLAFAGATAALDAAADEPLAVLDVGGGSSQLVVGTPSGGVRWSTSLPLGSGDLAALHLRSDPPSTVELDALRAEVAAVVGTLPVLGVARGLAVGGSATSLRRLAGPVLDRAALSRALALLASAPAAEVAKRCEIDVERVRLLPAGIAVLDAVAALVGQLAVACGGLREGVVRELALA
jgi:exopolyphosphatase / guanosine-5'-triphosphate,3'-diphosphate pyrophosphatase